ncbi:hypothetical protein FHT44_003525 [Mycolicibacterium sp. BK634]|uniref:hypothetical protein n=1 Tax=Mycolicibacterium sp. BK634 TaxID=2587099 RepID=UPI0016197716|nr:hypothetical protein [Mycolicibacterium sp. BK634]MBB3751030.1 hypothetical protein [Mycolicibacterium sp. BK634]
MIGRDKIVVNFCDEDRNDFSRSYCGTAVTEQRSGHFDPFNVTNYYRLILRRSIDRSDGTIKSIDFGTKLGIGLETPIVAILDGRGRVHHYECTVKSG